MHGIQLRRVVCKVWTRVTRAIRYRIREKKGSKWPRTRSCGLSRRRLERLELLLKLDNLVCVSRDSKNLPGELQGGTHLVPLFGHLVFALFDLALDTFSAHCQQLWLSACLSPGRPGRRDGGTAGWITDISERMNSSRFSTFDLASVASCGTSAGPINLYTVLCSLSKVNSYVSSAWLCAVISLDQAGRH